MGIFDWLSGKSKQSKKDIQNEKGLEKYIDKILTEKPVGKLSTLIK